MCCYSWAKTYSIFSNPQYELTFKYLVLTLNVVGTLVSAFFVNSMYLINNRKDLK